MEQHTICLLNDSFPPAIDGVANAVINYAKIIEENYGHAIVATPSVPGAHDAGFSFPVLRYPSIDTRKLVGYVAGYPFSPEVAGRLSAAHVELLHAHCPVSSCLLARSLRDVVNAPLVLTYHTKFDIDIAKAIRGRVLQTGAIRALVQNVSACDEVWVVSRGAGENLRSLGYEGDYIIMENGVDLPRGGAKQETVFAATKDYDLPDGVPVFLFVGRLMWYKGLRMILDALRTLRESGTDFRMVFIGDGADGAQV
ncbi:MAG: glycosyltransferase, partial [Oscillospiraceae bacterium]|nr:glycosyltransferase [Oscillospiraceae bacterium]